MKPQQQPHARLSAEEVKACWLEGDYTSSGYLFHLVKALRKDGWKYKIESVKAFCEEWEIDDRQFYRAKSKLISRGRLGEKILGQIEIWIADSKVTDLQTCHDKNVSPHDKNVSPHDKNVSPHDKNVASTPLNPLPALEPSPSSSSSQIYYNSLSVAHLPPAQERERGEAKLKEVIQESIDTHLDRPQPQTETKTTNLNSGEGNFSAAAAIAQNFRFKQGSGESVTVDVVGESIDPQAKTNAQCLNPVTDIKTHQLADAIPESDLLSFIESKAPDNVRSKRGWARACLASDQEYWEKTLIEERDRRENNAHLTGIPVDAKYGCQNHTAYKLFNAGPPSIAPKTVGNTRAMLHAKWSLLAFRQEAIDRAIILGFVVTEQGIFLPPNLDPEFPSSQWETF